MAPPCCPIWKRLLRLQNQGLPGGREGLEKNMHHGWMGEAS